ncbi:MAG: CYTH domain-containing protein [Bacteroidia bacterium]|nr:CYTH domain-containing protein [Bacteroidia bacterium]NNM24078.1 CYTH domain-containing protein [Flavobacteriaceae bacterium]
MIEIERKFLVTSEAFKAQATHSESMTQGFLNTHPDRTVRIRLQGSKGKLTVKGRSNEAGTTRFEWETPLSAKEAEALLELCEEGIIEKIRFTVPFEGHLFEVDVFENDNDGLIVAEVELSEENETFKKPTWLGMEVTGELKYYNSQLSNKPYKLWEQ